LLKDYWCALVFQDFQFAAVLLGQVFFVEHADQLALLVHIPDPHASGQAFVGHFRFVAFGYLNCHRQTPLLDGLRHCVAGLLYRIC
jgi:hypothetical protein